MFHQRKIVSYYKQTFNTEPGRIVLADMMKASCFMTDTGVLTDAELRQTEGARNLVRRIVKFLNMSDEELQEMSVRREETGGLNTDV